MPPLTRSGCAWAPPPATCTATRAAASTCSPSRQAGGGMGGGGGVVWGVCPRGVCPRSGRVPAQRARSHLCGQQRDAHKWAQRAGSPVCCQRVNGWRGGAPSWARSSSTPPPPTHHHPRPACLQDVRLFDPCCDPPLRQHYPFRLTAPQHTIIRDCEVGRATVRGSRNAGGSICSAMRKRQAAQSSGARRNALPEMILHAVQPPPVLASGPPGGSSPWQRGCWPQGRLTRRACVSDTAGVRHPHRQAGDVRRPRSAAHPLLLVGAGLVSSGWRAPDGTRRAGSRESAMLQGAACRGRAGPSLLGVSSWPRLIPLEAGTHLFLVPPALPAGARSASA